ncbi:hypothetical protein BJX65DRAFT_182674 [Aspergillus insuetus]
MAWTEILLSKRSFCLFIRRSLVLKLFNLLCSAAHRLSGSHFSSSAPSPQARSADSALLMRGTSTQLASESFHSHKGKPVAQRTASLSAA